MIRGAYQFPSSRARIRTSSPDIMIQVMWPRSATATCHRPSTWEVEGRPVPGDHQRHVSTRGWKRRFQAATGREAHHLRGKVPYRKNNDGTGDFSSYPLWLAATQAGRCPSIAQPGGCSWTMRGAVRGQRGYPRHPAATPRSRHVQRHTCRRLQALAAPACPSGRQQASAGRTSGSASALAFPRPRNGGVCEPVTRRHRPDASKVCVTARTTTCDKPSSDEPRRAASYRSVPKEAARYDLAPSTDVDGDGTGGRARSAHRHHVPVHLATGEELGAPLPDGFCREPHDPLDPAPRLLGTSTATVRADARVRQPDGVHCWLQSSFGTSSSTAPSWDQRSRTRPAGTASTRARSRPRLRETADDLRILCARGPG